MSRLIEHIGSLSAELAQMTRDGHHADPRVDRLMRTMDDIIEQLHAVNRHPMESPDVLD